VSHFFFGALTHKANVSGPHSSSPVMSCTSGAKVAHSSLVLFGLQIGEGLELKTFFLVANLIPEVYMKYTVLVYV